MEKRATAARPATESESKPWERATICVSSQVGCAVDCQFCLTALLGVKRNLTAGEIVGQVCAVLNDQDVSPPQDRVNLVFMGMGEPFLNYDNFMKAVTPVGGRRGNSGIANDGFNGRNCAAHLRFRRRSRAAQAGDFAERLE